MSEESLRAVSFPDWLSTATMLCVVMTLIHVQMVKASGILEKAFKEIG